jgi:hypothetical protein
MSDCVENTQSEIPLPRLRDRNDIPKELFTQTLQPSPSHLRGEIPAKSLARGTRPELAEGRESTVRATNLCFAGVTCLESTASRWTGVTSTPEDDVNL